MLDTVTKEEEVEQCSCIVCSNQREDAPPDAIQEGKGILNDLVDEVEDAIDQLALFCLWDSLTWYLVQASSIPKERLAFCAARSIAFATELMEEKSETQTKEPA